MATLLRELPWQQHEIVMFGKRSLVPRLEVWIGDPGLAYTYSGIRQEPHPWTPMLESLRSVAQTLGECSCNSVLVNRYRDGGDGVAWHADDEPELGAEPVIVSISLGASRRFQLRRRDDSTVRCATDLHHGDVLVMRGRTQMEWVHQIPKTSAAVGERINLTFRKVFAT